MPFIKFTESSRSYAPRASISQAGVIAFNLGAKTRFRLEQFQYAVLYFDPDTRQIGVELTNDKEAEGARPLRQRTTGADLAAKTFFDFFDIPIDETSLYPVEKNEETGYLCLNLKNARRRNSKKDKIEEGGESKKANRTGEIEG